MIEIVDGDLFDKQNKLDVIAHQVNCQGAMGKGIALQFRNNFPRSARAYQIQVEDIRRLFGRTRMGEYLLGYNLIKEENDILTCSMFAQEYYGYQGCYTDYRAFARCCRELVMYLEGEDFNKVWRLGMPYNIGCGMAGGSWNRIYHILNEVFGQNSNIHLILYRK